MKTEMLMWLFPVVFMIHEFEEILFVRRWIDRNREKLASRFPRLSKRALSRLEGVSTASFAFVVAEEFILVSIVTFAADLFSNYALFIGLVIAYGVHQVVHILQFLVYRGYIPAIVTGTLTGIYTVYVIRHFYLHDLMPVPDVIIYSIATIVILVLNLALMHLVAGKLDI
jgi:hypothetical protein